MTEQKQKPMLAYTSDQYSSDNQEGKIKTTYFAGNGIFEKRKSWLGESIVKVNDYQIIGYPNMSESIKIANTDFVKIPSEAIKYIFTFYRLISIEFDIQAQVVFYNIKDKEQKIDNVDLKDIEGVTIWNNNIFSYVPKQICTKDKTIVSSLDEYYDKFNKKFGIYLETHSHNTKIAFMSEKDKENSMNDSIQFIFGKFGKKNEAELFVYLTICGKRKIKLNMQELGKFVENVENLFVRDDKVIKIQNCMLDTKDKNIRKILSSWRKNIKVAKNKKYDIEKYQDKETLLDDYSYFDEEFEGFTGCPSLDNLFADADKRENTKNTQVSKVKFKVGDPGKSMYKYMNNLYSYTFKIVEENYKENKRMWNELDYTLDDLFYEIDFCLSSALHCLSILELEVDKDSYEILGDRIFFGYLYKLFEAESSEGRNKK